MVPTFDATAKFLHPSPCGQEWSLKKQNYTALKCRNMLGAHENLQPEPEGVISAPDLTAVKRLELEEFWWELKTGPDDKLPFQIKVSTK